LSDNLLSELLAKPIGKAPTKTDAISDFTSKIEVAGDMLYAEIRDTAGLVNEGRALRYIKDEGQDPAKWEVSSWYKVEYGPIDPETGKPTMESVKFTFKRRTEQVERFNIDEILENVKDYKPTFNRPTGQHGFVVLLGDMQFFKIDGDGVEGTVARVINGLNAAADRLERYRRLYDIGHIHIAWLGDHIEGFVSQGGANVWRTNGTLSEQIRLTRRVMMHALKTFAPLADKVTMAAVPGNHGETVRFEGTGVTRYDDSHDTESLIAIADIAEMMPEAFGHVDFYVPDNDELIVVTEVADTVIAHHHGHKWRPNKHFEWWGKQAFNRKSPMQQADMLVAGHLHHEHFESEGDRVYWGINALESESTWFRHNNGTQGAPGIHVGIVRGGYVHLRETIHFTGKEVVE
jgi:hypothetical protein